MAQPQTVEKVVIPRRKKLYLKNENKAKNNLTAGDTSNITCCLSLFAASSLTVPLYADRLKSAKYP